MVLNTMVRDSWLWSGASAAAGRVAGRAAARPATRPAAALASRAAPLQLYTIYSHYIVISK